MGKALYRKHRPKKLSEIIGQQHITDTLKRALKNQHVSHAYLLTGPRGVGKTSVARILAYEVNKLPYDEEATHMDIIEIDAASNRRIDEIRELKERVNIAPTSAKYKVYIIDEVHMLTKEAFNALLKTLEEPPAHAIFILATTEAHKVPDTIISRTQRFTFKPVETAQVVEHLKSIASYEKIVIDSGALELIANYGEGSFRDSISLLDQVRHTNSSITLTDIQKQIGQAPDDILDSILGSINSNNLQQISACLNELRQHGVQASQISHQLSVKLRNQLSTGGLMISKSTAIDLLTDLLNVSAATDPAVALEIALYKTALENDDITPKPATKAVNTPKLETPSQKPETKQINAAKTAEPAAKISQITKPKPYPNSTLNEETWQDVLNSIKSKHNTLYGIARMATPKFEPTVLTLTLNFAFHHKRLDDPKNKQYLQDLIAEVTGHELTIICVLDKQQVVPKLTEQLPKTNKVVNLETISNIFGGAEIVE